MAMRKILEGGYQNCPIRDILDRIADRWSLLVLLCLQDGTLRFSELRRTIGDISQRMLSLTVRRLEQDGFVSRTVHPTVPPSVEYSLTELGRSVLVPVGALVEWAKENQQAIHAMRERKAA